MRRKIFAILITLCILLQAALPASAAVLTKGYTVTEKTSIEEDLEHMLFDGEKFDSASFSTEEGVIRIVRFLEVGYESGGFGDTAELYVFLYSTLDGIIYRAVQNAIGLTLFGRSETLETHKYNLIYCDQTADERFTKYKVDIDPEYLRENLTFSIRNYRVSDLELITDGDQNTTAYNMALEYCYTGTGADLTCSVNDTFTIELELGSTYYQPDVVAEGGLNTRNELHSVYFSIPDWLIAQYSDGLYSVQGEYYEYRIGSVITENAEFAEQMFPLEGTAVSELTGYDANSSASPLYPSLNHVESSATTGMMSVITIDYSLNQSAVDSVLSKYRLKNPLPCIPYIFYVEDIVAGEIAVSSETIKERVLMHGDPITTTGDVHREKTEYDISIEDGYVLPSFASTHSDFETFIARLQSWFQQDVSTDIVVDSAIEIVNRDILNTSASKLADKYFIAESDVPDIKNAYIAAKQEEKTLYLLRFDQSDVKTVKMVIEAQNSGINVDTTQETYYYEQNYYKDFDVLSLSFMDKEQGLVVVPVSSSPIDHVGDQIPRDDGTLKIPEDWWKRLIAVVFAIVLVMLVIPRLKPFLDDVFEKGKHTVDRWWEKIQASLKPKKRRKKKKKDPPK